MSKPGKNNDGNGALEMTLGEILELYNLGIGNTQIGNLGLNGYQKAVGQNVMVQPFSLTDEVRQKITRCKFALRPFFEEVDRAERLRITQEVMGTPAVGKLGEEGYEPPIPDTEAFQVPEDDKPRQALWSKLYAEAMKARHTVHGLHIFDRADLFRENRNPISNEVELALGPIIKDSPWRQKHVDGAAAAKETEPPGGDPPP